MGIITKAVVGLVLSFVIFQIGTIIHLLDPTKVVYNHSPGPCHIVPGIDEGSEDIYTLSNGKTIITSGLKWGSNLHNPLYNKRKGRFYMFDFNNVEAGVTEIPVEGGNINNPHGIGVWEQDNQVIVFVVSHTKTAETVVQLEYDRERNVLKHMKTITDPLFQNLNDVVPTGPNSFYVTNLFGASKQLESIEIYLKMKWANVVHYDGVRGKYAARELRSANGINMSPDGKYVYVASTVGKQLYIFKRLFDNSLQLYNTYPLYSLPDNIDVDRNTGDVWIGCQPIVLQLIKYLEDPSQKCPSQVLKLKVKDGEVKHMEEVYAENSQRLEASTIASRYKDAMLIGTIMDKLVYCQINHLE